MTGNQDFTRDAPVNLIYVADLSRMGKADREMKDFYSAADTGLISQNVYLFCASEGLATVVLGYVDKPAPGKKIGLRLLDQPSLPGSRGLSRLRRRAPAGSVDQGLGSSRAGHAIRPVHNGDTAGIARKYIADREEVNSVLGELQEHQRKLIEFGDRFGGPDWRALVPIRDNPIY